MYDPYSKDSHYLTQEWCLDIESTVKRVLTAKEYLYAKTKMLNCIEFDRNVTPESASTIYEKLGRAFVANKLYPLSRYFRRIKKGDPGAPKVKKVKPSLRQLAGRA